MKNIIYILLLINFSSFGQRMCGTPSPLVNTPSTNTKSFTSYTFRVYYHIIAKNNGNNPTSSSSSIITAHNSLNARFISSNICFVLSGYDVIESNYLRKWKVRNNSDYGPLTDDLFSQNVQSNAINIYIIDPDEATEIDRINSNNLDPDYASPIGQVESIIGHSLLIRNDYLNNEVLTHEMGHILGLYHTFEEQSNGIDDPNTSSDDDDAGDRCEDTPAQPSSCSTLNSNCDLTCSLPYNTTVLKSNFMVYSVNTICLQNFTNDQRNRMYGIIDQTADLQQRLIPTDRTIAIQNIPFNIGPITLNDFVFEAKGTLTVQDVNIQAPGKAAFRAEQEVILEPGYDALEGCRALVIIENICKVNETQAKSSDFVSNHYENEGMRIDEDGQNSLLTESTNSIALSEGIQLSIYPNPFNEIIRIESDFESEFDESVSVEIYDLNGKLVLSEKHTVLELNNGLEINTQLLNKGFFIIHVKLNNQSFISKITKQ